MGGALYHQAGLIEVPTVQALLDTSRVLATQPDYPVPDGPVIDAMGQWIEKDWQGVQMIEGFVEETLNLSGVQIHRDDAVDETRSVFLPGTWTPISSPVASILMISCQPFFLAALFEADLPAAPPRTPPAA